MDKLTRDTIGHSNIKDGPGGTKEAAGPFGFGSANRDGSGAIRGYSAGVGLASGNYSTLAGTARNDFLQAQAHFGGWTDSSGQTNVGAEVDAAALRLNLDGFEAEVLSANAGGKVSEETASLGAQANLASVAQTFGGEQHSARLGASVGVGLAGRAHYGDADGDGVHELGLGADFGPFAVDVKSELLGHAWNDVSSGAVTAWDTVTSW